MESNRELPNPELIESYMSSISASIKPSINQDSTDKSILQHAVQGFINHIDLINQSYLKEGIHVEKDLFPVHKLLQAELSLENIANLHKRILENNAACSGYMKKAGTAAGVGSLTILGAIGMTVFAPAIVPSAALIAACSFGSTLLPAGIGITLDTRNKRGELVSQELNLLSTILNEIKQAENYSLYAQAHLKICMQNAQSLNSNETRDIIIEKGISTIADLRTLPEITRALINAKDNLVGNDQSSEAAVKLDEFIVALSNIKSDSNKLSITQ